MKHALAAVVLLMFFAAGVRAEEIGMPLQIGIYPPAQLIPEDADVRGLRLSLPYSVNNHVVGIDIGIASTASDIDALQVNLYSMVYGEMTGVQIALLATTGSGNGLQISLLNRASTVFEGIQCSLINMAEDMTGIQIGLINRTEFLTGLQIGLVNVIEESAMPFFPIINFSF